MPRALASAITGVVTFWIVYSIYAGIVFGIAGCDIHNGWAAIAGLSIAFISAIAAMLKIYRWLKRTAEQARE